MNTSDDYQSNIFDYYGLQKQEVSIISLTDLNARNYFDFEVKKGE